MPIHRNQVRKLYLLYRTHRPHHKLVQILDFQKVHQKVQKIDGIIAERRLGDRVILLGVLLAFTLNGQYLHILAKL